MTKQERHQRCIQALVEAGVPNKACYPVIKAYQRKEGGAWRFSMKCERMSETQYWRKRDKYDYSGSRRKLVEIPWTMPEIYDAIREGIQRFCSHCDYELCPELDQVVEKRYWCIKYCDVRHCPHHHSAKEEKTDEKRKQRLLHDF